MSDLSVKVVRISSPVEHHPNADRLSLIKILGYTCISAKLDDGRHRYEEGDLVVYCPEGAIVPEYLLKRGGFWNDEKGIGMLAGSKGNRVKALKLRDIFSQGILFSVENQVNGYVLRNEEDARFVEDDDDVSVFLGITKYEPPIPIALAGEVCNIHGKTSKYDFESIQTLPDLFAKDEEVVVTEKLHGTNLQVSYVPNLEHSELFFDGNIYVCSKGLGGQGLVFKNNEKNIGNVYVKTLNKLLENGFGERIKSVSEEFGQPVRVFGEVFGGGIQKGYGYGKTSHDLAVFDIQVGWEFLSFDEMIKMADRLDLPVVPILHIGPYDLDVLVGFRDGRDTIANANIREGIVIKARDGSRHPHFGRKIGKWVSPNYLLKATGEEFN